MIAGVDPRPEEEGESEGGKPEGEGAFEEDLHGEKSSITKLPIQVGALPPVPIGPEDAIWKGPKGSIINRFAAAPGEGRGVLLDGAGCGGAGSRRRGTKGGGKGG